MAATLSREAELRAVLQTKSAELDEFSNSQAIKIEGNNMSIDPDAWKKAQQVKSDMEEIQAAIAVEVYGAQVKSFLQDPASSSTAQALNAGLITQQEAKEIKTLGQMFSESPEFEEMKKLGKKDSAPMELNGVQDIAGYMYGTKDVMGASPVGTRPFGTIQFDPMVPRQHRQFRVRDLFPAVSTSATLIDYFRVMGFVGGDASGNKAASVADRRAANGTSAPTYNPADGTGGTTDVFGIKPQSKLAFTSQQAPVRTIAHWEAAHRNVLDDVPQLRGTIDNELLYGLRLEEDRQILSGSGSNDELLGILNTPGIQTYTQTSAGTPAAATEQLSDALRRAATKVVIANYQATGYVLHPNNWEDVELQKATGDGQYMLVTNIAIGAQTQVWRQPVVETVAIAENTFLTGAFGLGAQLYDRQQANVRTAEQHADFFVRNAIVILVEERLALAVKRPEAFVKGTFFV